MLDKICVLRAVSTNDNAHSSSGYWMLTGVPHQPTNAENAKPGAPNDWPCIAAVVQRLRPAHGGLPASITLPEHIWNTGDDLLARPGRRLPRPLGRPVADPLRSRIVRTSRFPASACRPRCRRCACDGRLSLLEQVNQRLDDARRGGRPSARFDVRSRQAFDLLRAGQARRAFDLDGEPPAVRDRYGRNRWGQSVLLARRLVEAGVSLVQVNWTRMPGDTADSPAWDTHARNAAAAEERPDAADGPGLFGPAGGPGRRAACWTRRWWCGWASSAGRRRSTPAAAATTGATSSRWRWPAAACAAARCTAPPTASAAIRARAACSRRT